MIGRALESRGVLDVGPQIGAVGVFVMVYQHVDVGVGPIGLAGSIVQPACHPSLVALSLSYSSSVPIVNNLVGVVRGVQSPRQRHLLGIVHARNTLSLLLGSAQ